MSSKDEGAASAAPSATRRGRPRPNYERGEAKNPVVIEWVGGLREMGWLRNDIVAASKAGEMAWPGGPKGLSDGVAQAIYAVLADRDRRTDEHVLRAPKRKTTESGTRLRQLHVDKREGVRDPTSDLWKTQVALAEAATELERFDLPELKWTEEIDVRLNELVHELERHRAWSDRAWDVVWAHMDDVGRQRTLRKLRDRANDPSSEPWERRSATNLADRLEEKYRKQRALGA